MTSPLGPAALVRIVGRDALAFAHAQFTSDVRALADGAWHWSAWLDAQGRARAVFALLRTQADELLAWQPLGEAAMLRDALARFVLRAAVRVETVEGTAEAVAHCTAAAGRWSGDRDSWSFTLADGRGVRLAAGATAVADPAALDDWRRHDIDARLPLLATTLAGEFTPQALDLEAIDAIRFDKGCYPGQEVAARLHFRGGNKRHLQRAAIEGPGVIAPGDTLFDPAGTIAGKVLYAAPASRRALGVLVDGSPHILQTTTGARFLVDGQTGE